jgi:hypothetical protein
MEDIYQADSFIETSQNQEHPDYKLKSLYHENTLLREELKKISSKLDEALKKLPPTLLNRVESPKSPRSSSSSPLLTLAFSMPLHKSLEKKIEILEQENKSLKQKVQKNQNSILNKQLQPLFQRHSKFLTKILKAECILNKIDSDFKENQTRINYLNEKIANISSETPQTPSFGMKTAYFPELSHEKSLDIIYDKEKRLKQELEIVNETLKSKQNQLLVLEQMNQKYLIEIRTLEKTKNDEKLKFKEIFSPVLTKKINSNYGSEKILRNRPRYFSNKQKVENENLNTLRHSGSLEPLKIQLSGTNIRQVSSPKETRKSVERIFRGIKLKPEEFEFTQNFSKNRLKLAK